MQASCPAPFQNHDVNTTGWDIRKWKLSCMNWSSLYETSVLSLEGTHPESGRGVLVATLGDGAEPRFAYGSPSPPCPRNGCRLVSFDIFHQHKLLHVLHSMGNFLNLWTCWQHGFFPCVQIQRGNPKEKDQKHKQSPRYTVGFVWCGFLSSWTYPQIYVPRPLKTCQC